MAWHQLKRKSDGETQIVASLNGIDPDEWDAIKLPREPKPDEDIIDGKIQKNAKKIKDAQGRSSIGHLSRDELIALIDERIALTEKGPDENGSPA